MGLFSWLFPGPEERVRRARDLIARGKAEFARFEVLDVDTDEARKVLAEAEGILSLRNLEAAVQYARMGDDVKASECLTLAETFSHGSHEELFSSTRRELREIRAARSAEEERKKADNQARLLAVDPLGFTGGPSWLDGVADPAMFEADREEIEQRLALVVENYPEMLRASVMELGADFGRAVLAIDEGRAEEALPLLVALPDESALVCWERARAAHMLGDPAAAANALRGFARLAGGHHSIGRTHSGVYLAELLTETGDLHGALRVLRDAKATKPKGPGAFLFAQLLFATGAHEEAEGAVTALIRQHPSEAPLYPLLARIRVAAGHPEPAMRALEQGLSAVCCTPGKCGSKSPDLDTHRLLATMYLEDKRDISRGLELAGLAAGLVKQPVWEDAYLSALVAKVRADPEAERLARRLADLTPEGHPGQARVRQLAG